MSSKKGNASSDDIFRFTLVGNTVTNLQELDDGIWKNESVSRNESWSFDGANLIYTKTSGKRTIRTIFNDFDKDGNYTFTSTSSTKTSRNGRKHNRDLITGSSDDDQYKFGGTIGDVTNLLEFKKGSWKAASIDSNEKWAFSGGNLIKTETKPTGFEIYTYGDSNLDGIFTKVSEVFTPI
jgi:hypothetical protein